MMVSITQFNRGLVSTIYQGLSSLSLPAIISIPPTNGDKMIPQTSFLQALFKHQLNAKRCMV